MNLDDAIEHAEEQAEISGVCDCAMEHKQLARWLRELKELRKVRVQSVCPQCGGSGKKVYASTSVYLGGIGGAAMTESWCDGCWGTGLKDRQGPDLKKMALDNQKAMASYRKTAAKAQREVARLKAKHGE